MLDDDVRIRHASQEEAEDLSDIAWSSRESWSDSALEMDELREFLAISEDFIEKNPTYIAESEETGEKLGFCSMAKEDDGEWWLRYLYVTPDNIGSGIGGALFLHACEVAEDAGSDGLYIISNAGSEEFYLHMGAERVGTKHINIGSSDGEASILKIRL
ncbi:MAG: GNAT family N-acetyltransferase [Synergistaceae bacterium]|nr:GNAT family N-acetyltransferase [Synergistaceae bacterium]